jgi:hypothetical protein
VSCQRPIDLFVSGNVFVGVRRVNADIICCHQSTANQICGPLLLDLSAGMRVAENEAEGN